MKQQQFEQRNGAAWDRFEQVLAQFARGAARVAPQDIADFPADYRRICHHLAMARERRYSPLLVERLNHLALEGHNVLYGARDERRGHILAFVAGGFPRLVRAERRLVALSALLFFGPLLLITVLLQFYPDFVYTLMSVEQVEQFEKMYSPTAKRLGQPSPADSAVAMFGYYIWNNIRIGFQTFAGGALFGVATLVYLLTNGFIIGTIAGHLTQIGYVNTFWPFVVGHGALELTAIVLFGAAGLKLGGALVSPGPLPRKIALSRAARHVSPMVCGAAGMLVGAAFIEAFWSPLTEVAPAVKYGVGALLWTAVLGYFTLLGRGRAH